MAQLVSTVISKAACGRLPKVRFAKPQKTQVFLREAAPKLVSPMMMILAIMFKQHVFGIVEDSEYPQYYLKKNE